MCLSSGGGGGDRDSQPHGAFRKLYRVLCCSAVCSNMVGNSPHSGFILAQIWPFACCSAPAWLVFFFLLLIRSILLPNVHEKKALRCAIRCQLNCLPLQRFAQSNENKDASESRHCFNKCNLLWISHRSSSRCTRHGSVGLDNARAHIHLKWSLTVSQTV